MSEPGPIELLEWIGQYSALAQRCRELRHQDGIDPEVIDAAAVRAVEVVGEAIGKLLEKAPVSLPEQLPELPWKQLAKMRDILAHKYFGVDMGILWDTIATDIPAITHTLPQVGALFVGKMPR